MNRIWQSWRSLRPREAAVFVVASLLFGAIDLTSLLEYRVGAQLPQVLARHMLLPQVSGLALLLCWLPATRSAATGLARRRVLIAATLLGSLLGMALTYAVMQALPWPSICDIIRASDHKPACSEFRLAALIGDTIWVFMPALMIVGVLEIRAQRSRQEEAAESLLREHSQLRRHALASQLAALQAQVEPGLLFDALVSVEQAYARRDADASVRLERLIRHLRVALPRLRDAGATLGSEAELIASYLDLLRDLNGHPPAFDCELGSHGATQLPPMLLLPLVQRALRLGQPGRCWLEAGERVTLGFDQEGLCSDDADLASLRERLAVLGAKLVCTSGAGRTEFTLELPA
ncbi:MAG: histidine kinase [Burkholderiales bacterium]|nr:histidine kinase [Burkholderiales bacterium]